MMPLRATTLLVFVVGLALQPKILSAAESTPSPQSPASLPKKVTFSHDVMSVLSKAGCNMGVCHGNQRGKGGFRLSLRGQDPTFDLASLTHDQFNRRISPLEPDRSLILLKATAQVAHGGGQRFTPDSQEYTILHQWIDSGGRRDSRTTPTLDRLEVSPQEQVLVEPVRQAQFFVRAFFSDGSTRDVTSLAVYDPTTPMVSIGHDGLVERASQDMGKVGETTVLIRYLHLQIPVRLTFVPARSDFVWNGPPPVNYVDENVFSKLRTLRMNPSEPSSDAVFLRRAYLDLLGLLPTAAEARDFVTDSQPDKRSRLIERLLSRPEFADHWAQKWSDLLRIEEKTLDRKGVENFHHWIRRNIADGVPINEFVQQIIAARGNTYSQPAANFYRANRDPISRAEAAAQVFLGIRLQCAKCHNHPFDRWTQDDYYNWAALFARVDYKIIDNRRNDKNDKHQFDGEQIVWMANEGDVENPRLEAPAKPQFLGSAAPVNDDAPVSAKGDRLEQLARWATDPTQNPYFARSQVNRIWYHLMGRGIVEPIDDFRSTNPAVNPPLLEALTADFISHKFDLRHVIRTIMNSRTYQTSAVPNATNAEDEVNFSHTIVRRLSAEQLFDGLNQVAEISVKFAGYPRGLRAGQLPGVKVDRGRNAPGLPAEDFLTLFGKPPRLLTCECERSTETTLGQAFQLMSGPTINELLTSPQNRLTRLLAEDKTDAQLIDELYWTALSRPPSAEELQTLVNYVATAKDRREALEDTLWGLLNAKEFILRQ
jgi:hypothetical protein